MSIIGSLKKGTLIPGVFASFTEGPKPAKIYFKVPYSEKFEYLRSVNGFRVVSSIQSNNPEGYIQFQLPVTPPTIQLDTGNSKDTEQVARVGEVVLPKYKKAIQLRWDSFFPYDVTAPYLNPSVRSAFSDIGRMVGGAITSAIGWFTGVSLSNPTPADYIGIFLYLSKTEKPFEVSMTYYEGGHIGVRKYTLDSFQTEPESNGDYKYNISIVEWTDVKPKQLNSAGEELPNDGMDVSDKVINKKLQGLSDFWNMCKGAYGVVSKSLLWAVASYNKIRNFAITTELATWKIKGVYKKYTSRFSILNNLLGKSKITSADTKAVSQSLKALSFTKASQQMAELLKDNMRT